MDRGAWQAAVHGFTKSRTRLRDLAQLPGGAAWVQILAMYYITFLSLSSAQLIELLGGVNELYCKTQQCLARNNSITESQGSPPSQLG